MSHRLNLKKFSFLVYGLGSTGHSVIKYFKNRRIHNFYVWDDNVKLRKKFGSKNVVNLKNILKEVDYIVLSPGISLKKTKYKKNLIKFKEKIITDIDLLYLSNSNFKSIVVTGSNGKSTTCKIIAHLLKKNKFNVELGGNIGTPVLNMKIKKNIFLVIEASSFQLSHSKFIHPNYAILLNITNDHLDWHGSTQEYVKSKNYGKARNVLPKQIAEPFVFVAKKLDVFPWLDYHYAYSLGNFKFLDGTENYHWSNLDQCVKFSGKKDETGFIMNHVDINQHSPKLVQSVLESLISIKNNNNDSLNFWLEQNYKAMIKVNDRRKDMWQASRWKNYNDFRIFIMGIKGNDEIFGEGLIYQGVSTEPKQYRGQTGAQDNIIPMQDIFSGVINFYPKNEQ